MNVGITGRWWRSIVFGGEQNSGDLFDHIAHTIHFHHRRSCTVFAQKSRRENFVPIRQCHWDAHLALHPCAKVQRTKLQHALSTGHLLHIQMFLFPALSISNTLWLPETYFGQLPHQRIYNGQFGRIQSVSTRIKLIQVCSDLNLFSVGNRTGI